MLGVSGPRHMRAQQQQPPQEVLSYYVHGNPFVHQDNTHNRGRDTSANGNSQSAIQQQYTLAGARSAVATRLQVGQSLAQQVCAMSLCGTYFSIGPLC
jgi:hypothetical protein